MTTASKYLHINKLRPWDKNPRTISDQAYQSLKQKIQRWGQFKPVICTPDGEVIGGNMRLRAYQELGITDVWVSIVEPKSEAEKLEIAITDNEASGRWQEEQLAEYLEQYKGEIDLGNYQVDLGNPVSLDELLSNYGPEPVEDEVPEIQEEAVSKLGEVYQLGRHRVMCGDSTKIEDVEKLMDGKKADMVFTDPPYNINYEGKTKKRLKIQNDSFDGDGFYKFLLDVFVNYYVSTKEHTPIYVCHADMERISFETALKNSGYTQKQNIIWAKDSMVLGRQDYHWQHEPILYGWKEGGGEHLWFGGRDKTTLWTVKRPTVSKEHPTMKPIELCAKGINNSSLKDGLVLDFFLGSGSTLIACEQTNRICYGMELDPKYVDVIRKRYAKFIGKEEEWQTITPAI